MDGNLVLVLPAPAAAFEASLRQLAVRSACCSAGHCRRNRGSEVPSAARKGRALQTDISSEQAPNRWHVSVPEMRGAWERRAPLNWVLMCPPEGSFAVAPRPLNAWVLAVVRDSVSSPWELRHQVNEIR
ncbi:uncharacterized protein PG998_011838 [Apiospora kogelbergensis]|uniref:uncharacterized protein n=1 Tax=Apiospora kogelbergensis TaxID=1337665 RepID=UPI003131B2B3